MQSLSSLIARERVFSLVFVDVVSFVFAFSAMIVIRYSNTFLSSLHEHIGTFFVLLIVYCGMFYAHGLYDLRLLRNSYDLLVHIFTAAMFAGIGAAVILYFIPFGISPKINLILFGALFFFIDSAFRAYVHLHFQRLMHTVLLISSSDEARELERLFRSCPHLGYRIVKHISDASDTDPMIFPDVLLKSGVDTVIMKSSSLPSSVLELNRGHDQGISFVDLANVYEVLFKKLLLGEKEKYYFLTQFGSDIDTAYERFRGLTEKAIACVLVGISIPFVAILALCVVLTSGAPIFYSQTRVGRKGQLFQLWKFRTMKQNAEPNGPIWASQSDRRITRFGAFLRSTHLDELPQLINILRGEMSFVGPRPERPEFVESLKREIPLFHYRHAVLPGVTGWAQVNYPYGSSINDAREKLMYDLYYMKNRSFILDLLIVMRSIPLLFSKQVREL